MKHEKEGARSSFVFSKTFQDQIPYILDLFRLLSR